MELKILDLEGKEEGKIKLPDQFNEEVRPDLIKRAVLAVQSHNRHPYGAAPMAGKRSSAVLSRRRRDYRGSYGIGISRVPRKIMSRRGTRMNWVGAFAPGMVGGRRAHPPKAGRIWWQKINKKERRKAIRSAISATVIKEIVEEIRKVPNNYPFIIDSRIEDLEKTKIVKEMLEKLGFKEELERASKKTIRAGKGKSRGRKYRKKKSLLIVVSKECKLMKGAQNLTGIDVVEVKNINAELLAPGCIAGRPTLWTNSAVEIMEKEKLFME